MTAATIPTASAMTFQIVKPRLNMVNDYANDLSKPVRDQG
jgi:hypothetical protein